MLALTLALTLLYTSEAKSQLKISGDYLQIVDDLGQIFIFHVSHLERIVEVYNDSLQYY